MMTNAQNHFDYIITGGGCAGLSLAYHLLQTPLREKRILIIDKEEKVANDRTWCFWEKEENPFEEIVYRTWKKVHFYGHQFSKRLDLLPYQYKMIRGIDFYQFVQDEIANCNNLKILQGNIQKLENTSDGASVVVDGEIFTSKWIFNSIPEKQIADSPHHYHLLQHFKGWIIYTEQPTFRPDEATLMDFRVEQYDDTRFIYVLPMDEYTALVEYTVFSPELLEKADYDRELKDYLHSFLKLETYKLLHEEFGVIPMTNQAFPARQGKHIINIGTAGGQTKPSTGYTFTRIQKQTQKIVHNLLHERPPLTQKTSSKSRFWWYDSIMLNVLLKNRCSGKKIFTRLFRNNHTADILAFLDEQTNIFQEFKITNTMPQFPFIKATIDLLGERSKSKSG